MLPIVIHEHSVKSFCFYQEGNLYEGISHHNRLYKLVGTFSAEDAIHAQVMGCNLIQLGSHVIITTSCGLHKVWAELRANFAPEAVGTTQNEEPVEPEYA